MHEELLELVGAQVVVSVLEHALEQSGREQPDPGAFDRILAGGQLLEDRDAVASILQGPGHGLQLSSRTAESMDDVGAGLGGDPVGVHLAAPGPTIARSFGHGKLIPPGVYAVSSRLEAADVEELVMKLEQVHLESLGHASYLVASDETGDALVVDPRRDVDVYLGLAHEQGYRIRYVVDTHQHNDYLSGLRELVERTGATALASSYTDRVGFDHRPVRDGEQIEFGEVGIEVLHTPGHTPEHLSFVLFDGEQDAAEPAILLSGGALLVGDLARPDLLGSPEQTRRSAEAFCATIQKKILELPDHVLVYPTHVAGSLCGGSIGSRLVTTVGYERRANEILRQVDTTDAFVRECLRLDNLPAVPPYWRRMRGRNAEGVEPLGIVDPPRPMTVGEVAEASDGDVIVLDTRQPEAFAGGHIPGALNVGLGSSFPTWAGTVLPEDARTILVLDDPAGLMEATWGLLRIGYPGPDGYLRGGMFDWRTSGRDVERLPTVSVHDVAGRLDDYHVLDVRQPAEWADGHAPHAQFITGAELPSRLDEVPRDRTVLVVCGSGYRSSVAASLLHRNGHRDVVNLLGGMTAWTAADLPTNDA